MTASENQIVVYQPNETVRLETRYAHESVWLTQLKIAELFGVQKAAISKHLKNIYSTGELSREATVSKMETVGTQCGKFTKTICGICHDRFIIVDQKEIFWTGASLKDAGQSEREAA